MFGCASMREPIGAHARRWLPLITIIWAPPRSACGLCQPLLKMDMLAASSYEPRKALMRRAAAHQGYLRLGLVSWATARSSTSSSTSTDVFNHRQDQSWDGKVHPSTTNAGCASRLTRKALHVARFPSARRDQAAELSVAHAAPPPRPSPRRGTRAAHHRQSSPCFITARSAASWAFACASMACART